MSEPKWHEHEGTDEPVCPHCGEVHGDAHELADEDEMTCGKCEKVFKVSRDVQVTYSTRKE